jgi:hypothetical protein
MWHSKNGNFGEVENLLVSGVDPTIYDSFGYDALYYAEQEHKQDVVELLQKWKVLIHIFPSIDDEIICDHFDLLFFRKLA